MNGTGITGVASQQPLPWQSEQWQRLMTLLSTGRLPHALLFRGPSGTGKVHFARALAQRLLCATPCGDIACGSCKYCNLYACHSHPDLFVAQPEESSRNIKIEQIRDLIGFTSKKSQFEGFRIVLIQPAESMNLNAANALLKCLEEPGANMLLILITHQPSQLLPTIRSRCQSLDFPLPNRELAIPWLASRVTGDNAANNLLSLARGSPLKAIEIFTGQWQKQREHTFDLWLSFLLNGASMTEVADALSKYPIMEVLEWLAGWYVDIVRLSLDSNAEIIDSAHRSRLSALVRCEPGSHFLDCYDRIMELRSAIGRGANFNPQMALEGLLASLRA